MKLLEGVVTRSTGSWYDVRHEGQLYECRIRGKFRLNGVRVTNPVAVGDRVRFFIENQHEQTGMIKKILPRTNYVVRESPRRALHLHLLAANIDQAILFVTIHTPDVKFGFIDRFLLMTEPFDIPTYIIFNKADLYNADDLDFYYGIEYVYTKIGYKVMLVSAETGQGIQDIRDILKDKITLISGHSGVGKSTLTNAVQPGLDIKTQIISNYSGKGQHTTTFATMHSLDFGGHIIDTPGIKSLSFINMEPSDVAHNYREFFEASSGCKFSNCLHINEPHCAVKAAVEAEEISGSRYQTYLAIMDEIQNQNHWERNKEL